MNSMPLQPRLVVSKRLSDIEIDLPGVGEVMRAQGLRPSTIRTVTVYIDDFPRLSIRGSVWPSFLARFRYPQLKPPGHVIRLSGRMLFSGPTTRTINYTLIHEIEHVAQIQRRDPRIAFGYFTNLVFLAAGIGLGLTNQSPVTVFKMLIILITGLFGLQLGYMLSWHEIQARQASRSYRLSRKLIRYRSESP